MKKRQIIVSFALLVLSGMLFTVPSAFAVAAPTDTNAFLYPVYDLLVIKIGAGPTMFCVGFIGICVAAYFLWQHNLGRMIGSLVATGMFVGAVGIVPTLGMVF